MQRQTAYEAALPQSPAHLDKKLGKVVRAVDHEVEAVKMLEIRIADNTRTIRSEPRSQYLSVTILLGPSNRVQEGLTRESPYRTYLRALRTNPGFFFEALRRHAPEVFEVGNGRKFYGEEGEQWEPDIMTMHLNVPELKAVGEPKTKTFQKMNL
ncbi:hypothetical protein HY477_00095 [Candidatus Uhrbacteria bacterium]|nr:hypothetical protein [Candidatus Uhrbacteria bacterium]